MLKGVRVDPQRPQHGHRNPKDEQPPRAMAAIDCNVHLCLLHLARVPGGERGWPYRHDGLAVAAPAGDCRGSEQRGRLGQVLLDPGRRSPLDSSVPVASSVVVVSPSAVSRKA